LRGEDTEKIREELQEYVPDLVIEKMINILDNKKKIFDDLKQKITFMISSLRDKASFIIAREIGALCLRDIY
jgi:hypothetical protein